jgi:hypothetical protein
MSKEIEIARLLNVKVNTNTGQVFLEMEVTDPTWKQRILREWQDVDVKLVIEENVAKKIQAEVDFIRVPGSFDEAADLTEADFAIIREQISKWGSK